MGKGRNSQQMLIENQTLCDRKEMNLNSSNTIYKISLKGITNLNVETKHKASKKEHWRVSRGHCVLMTQKALTVKHLINGV